MYKICVYLHVLLVKYLLPPSDLNKEMQVEGINDYRRGKIKMMGKDNTGMPPNQLPSTCYLQMDNFEISHPHCEEVCFPLLEASNSCTYSRNFFSITSSPMIVTANIYCVLAQ